MQDKLRRKVWLSVAALALAIIVVGPIALGRLRHQVSDEADPLPADRAPSVPVEVATVRRQVLRPSLSLVGQIVAVPERTAVVSPQAGGWIEQVLVVEGQVVRQGDVLVEFDSRLAHSNVSRAEASVAEKGAVLKLLRLGPLPEEIDAARQDRNRASSVLASLDTQVAALKRLLDRNEISHVQYETKVSGRKAAAATVAASEARLKLLERGTRPERIEEAEALVVGAQADLQRAELALKWCTIRSPIDGVLVQLLARRGQFLDRAVPLATIIDLSQVFVQLRVPSIAYVKVPIGAPVDVQITAFGSHTFPGTIARIGGEADPLSGDVIMFATVMNQDGRLRPGLSSRVRLWLPKVPDALTVPRSAVADHSGTSVVTVIRTGKAYEVRVKLGVETEPLVQVLDGLSSGDVVATKGGYGLPNGCPVHVVTGPSEQ